MDEEKLIRKGYKIAGHNLVTEESYDQRNDEEEWINPRLRNERSVEILERNQKQTSVTKRVFKQEQVYVDLNQKEKAGVRDGAEDSDE